VTITVTPADNSGASNGTATFTRTYNSGTAVTLTAPATAGSNTFGAWTGCTSATTATCKVTVNANATVTATYAAPVTPSSVSVDQASIGPAITDQLLGMNLAAWYDIGSNATSIVNAFGQAGIKAVRWPGGSWSDVYHWQNNINCQNPPNGGGTPDPNSTFTNFMNDIAIPGGFDVALTADYGTNAACNGGGDPTEAAQWITAALSGGITVSHMTVGNEEYGSWEEDLHAKPNNPTTYASAVTGTSGYYTLIKAASPNTLIGVDVEADNTVGGWDDTVLANAKGSYDFVEYHFYPQGPGQESDTYLVQQAAQDLTKNINTVKSELATVGKSGTPIYVGEMGSVYTTPGKQSWSITQGLYAGQALGEMMNDGVSRATWWIGFGNCDEGAGGSAAGNMSASLYGWQTFGAYNVFSDGPSDGPCGVGSGSIGTMSPTARAFELFSKVAVNGESVLTANVTGDKTNVRAYAATSNGGTAIVLFNLSQSVSEPVVVSLSAQTMSSDVSVETYSKAIYDQSKNNVWAPPTTTDMGSQPLPVTLTLDPWSMNVVIIK
jgi:predicted heme/steroid binding protein